MLSPLSQGPSQRIEAQASWSTFMGQDSEEGVEGSAATVSGLWLWGI